MEQRKRILVVDDEPINLEFFEVMLSKLGFEVTMAENGQEALDAVRKIKPDLVILDNMMPKLTGWQVTKLIKSAPEFAEFADTPIIMFSALDDVKDKVEGLELGADDYITKPFNFAEVLARIRAVLRTHDLARQVEAAEKDLRLMDEAVAAAQAKLSAAQSALRGIPILTDLSAAKKAAEIAVARTDEAIGLIAAARVGSERVAVGKAARPA